MLYKDISGLCVEQPSVGRPGRRLSIMVAV